MVICQEPGRMVLHLLYGGNGYGGTERTNFIFSQAILLILRDGASVLKVIQLLSTDDIYNHQVLSRLLPGAKNEIVMGAIWVRPPVSGGCQTSFDLSSFGRSKSTGFI
jgi:hypothetical protein